MACFTFCRVDGTWLTPEGFVESHPSCQECEKMYLKAGSICPCKRAAKVVSLRKMLKNLSIDIYHEYLAGNMSSVSWREIRDLLAVQRFIYVVVGGKIVACAALRDRGRCNELGSLFVHPNYRGQGYAMTLASEMLKRASTMGKPIVALANMYSAGIFRKLGFAERPKSDMPVDLLPGCEECPQFGQYPTCRCRFMVYEAG